MEADKRTRRRPIYKEVITMITMAQGNLKRCVAARLSPGENLLAGLEKVCETYGIQDGILLSAIGSLDGFTYLDPIADPNCKAGYRYGTPNHVDDPVSVMNLSGMICHDAEGKRLLHVHGVVADTKGRAWGGHVTEDNVVLLTVDVVIGELGDGIEMGRGYDPDLEVMIFAPKQV